MLFDSYSFLPRLVLRTPARPFTLAIDEKKLADALGDAQFMEALYLASPALHEECAKWQRGEPTDVRKLERMRHALARYYTRLTSRCTPFGLFAGCSVIDWGETSAIQLAPARNTRHTRLDMHYLCALGQQLAERDELRRWLRYYPNTSLYHTGDEVRYVEQYYSEGNCLHQLTAIAVSEPLLRALGLAREGPTLAELVASLLEPDATPAEVAAFVEELIQAQILVSELAPTVTGAEYFHHLQAVMGRLQAAVPAARTVAAQLAEVHLLLAALDQRPVNEVADYERVVAALAPFGVVTKAGMLFQTDATQGLAADEPATLDQAVQATLRHALEVLAYLVPPLHRSRLTDFTQRFQARYEERAVPLLEALDSESGLAYTARSASRYSALVHDLVLPEASSIGAAPPRNAGQLFLRQKLREAGRHHHYRVDITLEELRARGLKPELPALPPSLGVLFRVVDAECVLLEGAGGSSAVNLLGRFAHVTPGITGLIEHITRSEQAHNPGVTFAEICHLPANRVGNLLQRPHFRALEIPYLAQSTRPAEAQVAVQDLELTTSQGQLVLRWRKTGQRILPRLSTAHNFTGEQALPVYQFLCDLQTQGIQAGWDIGWQAEALKVKFAPRLTCGRAVLAAASWWLAQADLRELLAASPADVAQPLAELRARWQLPRFFLLADGDNELMVDAENELLVRAWLAAIRPRPAVLLKEFLFDPATSPAHDPTGAAYVPQGIALLVRQAPSYATGPALVAPATKAEPVVKRPLALNSGWLYYKLYCGQLMADQILLEGILPLVADLQARGWVDHWFFIRYADPDAHLRVRWHLPKPDRLGEVGKLIGEYLSPFRHDRGIWKLQPATYRRELKRYGRRTIATAEALFHYQSEALLARMTQTLDEPTDTLWLWGLGAIQELLVAFGYPLARTVAFFEQLKTSFGREFGLNKDLKLQFDAKYRAARVAIEQALAPAPVPPALAAIADHILGLEATAQLEMPLDHLLGSYVHMLLNRLLPADARLHELVLYDFLFRHYQSRHARQRRQVTS